MVVQVFKHSPQETDTDRSLWVLDVPIIKNNKSKYIFFLKFETGDGEMAKWLRVVRVSQDN